MFKIARGFVCYWLAFGVLPYSCGRPLWKYAGDWMYRAERRAARKG